jgi:tRNA(His) 5'-end guanylyltransferase
MRLDGRTFHTITRACTKPFDGRLAECLNLAAISVLTDIQGAQCAYLQSDEINILVIDYQRISSEAWFDYNVQKMASIASGICSVSFSETFGQPAHFDCRVFNVPPNDVCNYFVWRQRDWERNSTLMFAGSFFSHNQLYGKKKKDMHEMLHSVGKNWADLSSEWKNGRFIHKESYGLGEATRTRWVANAAPIFSKNREAIEGYVVIPDEEAVSHAEEGARRGKC